MKTYLECIPCFINQAFRAAKTATDDDNKIKIILDKAGAMISTISMEQTPPETGADIYKLISDVTGDNDPYYSIKQKNITHALSLYAGLKKRVENSNDPLLTAIRLAIAGNVIDLGIDRQFDIVKDIENTLIADFAEFDFDSFKNRLDQAESILYIGDNSGEGVFDRILIEQLNKPVVFATREIPVINDITVIEAEQIGITKIAKVISSGSKAPGTILKKCSRDFVGIFERSDMVISKGQGNYESLSDSKRDIFFMLKAKCSVIAKHLNVIVGDIIFKHHKGTEI